MTTVDVLGVDLGGTNLRAMSATVSPLLDATIGSEHQERVSGFTPRRLIRRLRELAAGVDKSRQLTGGRTA